MKKKLLVVLILNILTIGLFATFVLSADVPMITKEELKAMLGNPDLVIFDVRLSSDYFSSDLKIKGAVRPLGECIAPAAFQYPKGKTFVFYCSSPNEVRSVSNLKHLIEDHRTDGYTNVYVLKGGWEEWLKANYPTEKK
ncbi:MAG: rhodanese-related (seleno)protein [Thermodesulfobacteriota bacterium]